LSWLEILAQCAFRGTVILAAAFAAAALLQWEPLRRPAALRHFVWTAAFAALLLLPVAMATLPKWRWAAPSAPVAGQVRTPGQVLVVRGNPATRLPDPLLMLWMVGCALAAARFFIGVGATSWMVRHASAAPYAVKTLEELRQTLGI